MDGRVRYTRNVIKESFITLLQQKPIQKITVKEICERAEINRATFYAHYHDAFDLLAQIENALFANMMSQVSLDQHYPEPNQVTTAIFKVIEQNADLCKVLFSENQDRRFLRRFVDTARDTMLVEWQRRYPHLSAEQVQYLYAFVIGGAISVIEEWVRMGMGEMPFPMGNAAQKVIETWGELPSA